MDHLVSSKVHIFIFLLFYLHFNFDGFSDETIHVAHRLIPITSTEMGDSTPANPGSHCYTKSRKEDSHRLHYSDPPSLALIYLPLPQPVMHLPAHFRSLAFHWLLHWSARTLSGINTPQIPYPIVFHPPAYEDGTDRVFQNVSY